MIKLKDLLFENEAPNIFVPRRMDDRTIRYNQITQKLVNKVIDDYNAKKNKDSLDELIDKFKKCPTCGSVLNIE